MQALILAGGEGTRLRPLTSTVPKPVVPLVDRPFIAFMLDWLRWHGVDDVVMSCGHLADGVRAVLGDGSSVGVRLRYMEEPRPLGTGGALKFAEDLLDDRFLMLNGDTLTDLDLTAQLAAHEASGARATLALYPVEDPSLLRARAARGRRRCASSSRSPRRTRSTPTTSPRARTCSRGRSWTCSCTVSARRSSATSSRGSSATASTGTSRGLLDGHRDARALPRGDVRHPRGQRRDRGRRAHGRDLRLRRGGVTSDGRIVPPALIESGCVIGAGARIGGRAVLEHDVVRRRGHDDRERGRDGGRRDRRALRAARLHRRRRASDRRPLRDRRA